MGRYKIVVIQGDGVGPEIIPEALRVLEVLRDSVDNLELEFTEIPLGAQHYLETGTSVSKDDLSVCSRADAILKGPVGLPDVRSDDGTEVGISIELSLRFELDLYANIRPIVLNDGEGVAHPLIAVAHPIPRELGNLENSSHIFLPRRHTNDPAFLALEKWKWDIALKNTLACAK